jgi:hypothetical protein
VIPATPQTTPSSAGSRPHRVAAASPGRCESPSAARCVRRALDGCACGRPRSSVRWREHANGRVLERPCVGAAARDEMDHGVSADDLLFDVEPKVGERRPPRRYDRADECSGVRASVAGVRELVAEEVIDGSEVTVVPDHIEVPPFDRKGTIRAFGRFCPAFVQSVPRPAGWWRIRQRRGPRPSRTRSRPLARVLGGSDRPSASSGGSTSSTPRFAGGPSHPFLTFNPGTRRPSRTVARAAPPPATRSGWGNATNASGRAATLASL